MRRLKLSIIEPKGAFYYSLSLKADKSLSSKKSMVAPLPFLVGFIECQWFSGLSVVVLRFFDGGQTKMKRRNHGVAWLYLTWQTLGFY